MKYLASFGRGFWAMCVAGFLFFASFNMMIPELPDFLEALGGGKYKYLIIVAFSVMALVTRPFSGKLADNIGRKKIMLIGAVACFVVGFIYPVVSSVFFFFVLRALHGISTGFTPTGNTAYIADIVPSHRRGEAMGIAGMMGSLGMAVSPVVGSLVNNQLGITAMFVTSSVFALIAMIVFFAMKETLPNVKPFRWSMLKLNSGDLFVREVWLPSFAMFFIVFGMGAILTLIPDFSKSLGIANKGMFFTVFMLASLSTRFFAGKASDRHGRRKVAVLGAFVCASGLFVLSFANTVELFYISAVIVGLGQGICNPTLFAWTADLAPEESKGKAISTLFILLELGVIFGSLIPGLVYDNEIANLKKAFLVATTFNALGVVLLVYLPLKKVYLQRRIIRNSVKQ